MYEINPVTRQLLFAMSFFALLFFAPTSFVEAKPFQRPSCTGVNSPFGPRIPPIPGASRIHAGVDYNCRGAVPILAGMDGSIYCKSKNDKNGAGNRCHLSFSCMKMTYMHLDDYGFKSGGVRGGVRMNYKMGHSGNTGLPGMGEHLHLEIRLIPGGSNGLGTALDPEFVFGRFNTTEQVCNNIDVLLDDRRVKLGRPVNANDDSSPDLEHDGMTRVCSALSLKHKEYTDTLDENGLPPTTPPTTPPTPFVPFVNPPINAPPYPYSGFPGSLGPSPPGG